MGIDETHDRLPKTLDQYQSQDCSDLMIHTKWDDVDKYSYSSHTTYTGTNLTSGDAKETVSFIDFGYCCRIWPKLELEEPSMLGPSNSTDWVRPEYSKAIFKPC